MSSAHFEWLSTGSTERPITFTLRRSNSGLMLAKYPSSVVQTGVKSRGWENRTAHESPIQSWKRIRPSVVSASKSGAVSPICNAISSLLRLQNPARHKVCPGGSAHKSGSGKAIPNEALPRMPPRGSLRLQSDDSRDRCGDRRADEHRRRAQAAVDEAAAERPEHRREPERDALRGDLSGRPQVWRDEPLPPRPPPPQREGKHHPPGGTPAPGPPP